jgi:hypothetical protein
MGEVIILSEWKKKRELAEIEKLQSQLDQIMIDLSVRRQFFMFDYFGNTIEIQTKAEVNEYK